MDVDKCVVCNEPIPEGIQVCPRCMKEAGAGNAEIEAAEELRDIARVLSLTASTDANIKEALQAILNIAERLEKERVNL